MSNSACDLLAAQPRPSGLSIDDANAIYQVLENSTGVRERHLEMLFVRMDALDNDRVGVLDIRLNACLSKLLSMKSGFYYGLEVSGSDPHQELLVKGNQTIEDTRRTCFSPSTCTCKIDAEPWKDFSIQAEPYQPHGDAPTPSQSHTGSTSHAVAAGASPTLLQSISLNDAADEDVGISELKRQLGFEPQMDSDGENSDNVELSKRRRLAGRGRDPTSSGEGGHPAASTATHRLTPMQIYMRKVDLYASVLLSQDRIDTHPSMLLLRGCLRCKSVERMVWNKRRSSETCSS